MEASNNTLDRMASYNFKEPIDIVCFEENSNDEIDLTSSPKSKNKENTKVVIDIDLNTTESEVNLNKSSSPTHNEKEVRKLKSATESKKRKINEKNSQNALNNDDTSKRTKTCNTNPINVNNVSDSLNSISKYLILILESLNHYMTTVRNGKSTSHDVSLAKKSFTTIKYHFFNSAYEHVDSHILPNENNQAFIHNFLNYTIDNATKRIKLDCNKGITEIYLELIRWVKQKKYKDTCDINNKTYLSNPPIIPDVTISDNSITPIERSPMDADQDILCIFSSGTPGRQVNINIEKSLMTYNNNNKLIQKNCSNRSAINTNIQPQNTNSMPQNTNSMAQNTSVLLQYLNTPPNFYNIIPQNHNFSLRNANSENTYGDRQVNNEFVARQNNLMRPIGPANEYLVTAENSIPHYLPPPRRLSLVSENNQVRSNNISSNSQSNAYYNYYHTTSNFQNNTYYGANSITQGRNGHIPNARTYEDGNLRAFRKDYNVPRMDMRVPPPPYHSPVAVHSSQMIQPVPTIPTVLPDLPSGPDLTRSCVSTDSGFVSPVQSKSTSNPLEDIMNDLFELENTIQPPKQPARTTTQANCHKLDWEVHRRFCPPPERKIQ